MLTASTARTALLAQWATGTTPTADTPVRLHFCAGGARAAFVVTDHGDRTRLAASAAVYTGGGAGGGLLKSGVRITQSVFRSGWPGHDYLDDPRFFHLMREAQAAGFEICPHNTSEDMRLPPDETRRNIDFYARHFSLDTWIDHFRLPTNLMQEGMKLTSPFYILDKLQAAGCRAAWSYHDRFVNPPDDQLDLLRPPAMAPYVARVIADVARLRQGRERWISARSRAASILVRLIGSGAIRDLVVLRKGPGRAGMPMWLRSLLRAPIRAARHAVRPPAAGFPVRWDAARALYWFDTARITLVNQCYTEPALARLIADNGIHIGHTYLGLESRRHFDFAFVRAGDAYRIDPRFDAFLDAVSGRIRAGEIWNPTLGEMTRFYDDLAGVRVQRAAAGGWEVENHGPRPVRGVTVRALGPCAVPGTASVVERRVGPEFWYVMDLAPGERIGLLSTVVPTTCPTIQQGVEHRD
jgi:hypothetical protein